MGGVFTAAQHVAAALGRRSKAVESVFGGATGRAAAVTALRGGSSGVRGARKSNTAASKLIQDTLGKHDKLTSTVFGRMRSSIGGQTAMAGVAGFGVGATHLFTNEMNDKFGDQLSGAEKFMLGGLKVGATIGGGLSAVTHLGRAGLMAKTQFSSKSVTGTQIAGHLKAAKTQAKAVQNSASLENVATMSTRLEAAGQWNRGAGGQFISKSMQKRIRTTGNRMGGQGNPSSHWLHNVNPRTNAPFRSGESGIRIERRRRQASTISNRAKTIQSQAKVHGQDALKIGKSLAKNRAKIDRVSGYEQATKFSAGKMALGLAKAPAMLGGAMLGKGAFWGKIEPGLQFTGAALGGGMIGGMMGGAVTGITAMRTGNLGRTTGPKQRQGGRSFSNLNYNATLSSHRRSH